MYSSTLWPGSCPPSPGLAPCAILICSSSALTRYSAVTPKRAEATCLTALRVDQVLGGHPEARRGHLLDRASAQIAAGVAHEALGLLAPFAGVRLAADAIHGDGEIL